MSARTTEFANNPEPTYAINGVTYNSNEVANTENILIEEIEARKVKVVTPTNELDTETATYIRQDRVDQKNLEKNIVVNAQTFNIDQFDPVIPGVV